LHKNDYQYHLPEDRIAKFPVVPRHNSKLLEYKMGIINDFHFYDLPNLLPADTTLIMNNAKVIPARIFCKKTTGAIVEVFLLQPDGDYLSAFANTESSNWFALIGNKKRWKEGAVASLNGLLTITWVERASNLVKVTWKTGKTFAEMLEMEGKIPIPPYLNRETQAADLETYQTSYAKILGAVAAPTAGLHFTPEVLNQLKSKNIQLLETTLHVGAGTFKPIDVEDITQHNMHAESFELNLDFLNQLIESSGTFVAVGTTSLRILESLHVAGSNILQKVANPLTILQDQRPNEHLAYKAALILVRDYLLQNPQTKCSTSIYIYPGKKIKSIQGLITNFHQPDSTLMLLVAASIGDEWKKVYNHALANDYRFLSYGDSSLLWM